VRELAGALLAGGGVPEARVAQRVPERLGSVEPIRRKLFERLGDRRLHVRRHPRSDLRHRARLAAQHPGYPRLRGRSCVRRLSGEHLVEHDFERVHVGARVQRALTTRLFRAHVFGGAETHAGLGKSVLAGT
jgi:hypothetical protein